MMSIIQRQGAREEFVLMWLVNMETSWMCMMFSFILRTESKHYPPQQV